jgi:hypothetical protein
MTHLMLTSALLFALLTVVAIAIGASLGIARDVMVDEAADADAEPGYNHGLAGDFGLGLQHATHFAQNPGRSFRHDRPFSARV